MAGTGRAGLGSFTGIPLLAPRTTADEPVHVERQHTLMQMKIKEIGISQGYNVWIPRADRAVTVNGTSLGSDCIQNLDIVFPKATMPVVENIDVLWVNRSRHRIEAMFEVEHSTTIYSGLLRLNDVLIDCPVSSASIIIDARRFDVFLRHVNRRTFEISGLSKLCSYYTYEDIDDWHSRIK